MKAVGVPRRFWGKAVMTVVYLPNRSPMKSLDGKTPFEPWHGKKPAVHHVKTLGYNRKMIFIGYKHDSKAYYAYDPILKRVHVMLDVVFDE